MSNVYNRKDKLYEKAKDEGYRSRAAYKLMEMHKSYGVLKRGGKILDLGAWPGGWLQVASAAVGSSGVVVGIDLVRIDPIAGADNVTLIEGDAREDSNIEELQRLSGGGFDVVLSDMSPKLTGIKEADQAGTVACAELALYIATRVLKIGGHLIIKVFKGNDTEQFIRAMRPSFNRIVRAELDSTRRSSNEFYCLAFDYKGPN